MAHGSLQLWYHNPDGKLIKIEGVYRMGQPHGYFRFMNEDDGILTEAKYLNGEPLENVNLRQNLKSKQSYLFKIPRKIARLRTEDFLNPIWISPHPFFVAFIFVLITTLPYLKAPFLCS